VRKWDCRLVSLSADMAKENRKLKEFLQAYLYAHPDVGSERKRISRQLTRLFRHYMRDPRALPAAHLAKSCEEPLARIVCDYIAGMTDNFFERQYQKVFGE
jgi:dGTPase